LDPAPPPVTRYPDVTIVLKGESIDPRKLPSSPRFCYWPDALERTPEIEEVLRYYDKVFTSVRPTPGWMEWLPTGWDPAIHKDLNINRGLETIYVGTANSQYKVGTIRRIRPDLVYGNGWNLGPEFGPKYLHDLTYTLNNAEILIDVHQSPNVGLNRKLFEMIACGFTLVDRVPGVEEILGWGLTHQVGFANPDEAKELIRYYLERPKERGEIWRLEREKIQEYTYEKAVEKVFNYLK